MPFHNNNSTPVAPLPVPSEDPYRNKADSVFQKSNNEKIKSCGAFPLSALLINSQHSMEVIKIPYVRTTHSTKRYELAFHGDNTI